MMVALLVALVEPWIVELFSLAAMFEKERRSGRVWEIYDSAAYRKNQGEPRRTNKGERRRERTGTTSS